jgi:hypothetical protein
MAQQYTTNVVSSNILVIGRKSTIPGMLSWTLHQPALVIKKKAHHNNVATFSFSLKAKKAHDNQTIILRADCLGQS